ncbi:hypothetical protein ACQJBY_050341 [Aegilops geniculata]
MLPTRRLPRWPEDPHAVLAGLCKEMTVNLWLHGAAARHGTRRYGGQSRDTMPLPPLSVAFSAALGAQRGGTRHASRIVLDAAAHYPASRLFQHPPSVRRNVWTAVGFSMESWNRSMDKAKEKSIRGSVRPAASGRPPQECEKKQLLQNASHAIYSWVFRSGPSRAMHASSSEANLACISVNFSINVFAGQRWEALLQAHDRHRGAAYPYL